MLRNLLIATFFLAVPELAHADPCEAIREGVRPAAVKLGATFSGSVTHVIDGDSLCVAIGDGPANWVEVRLSDFDAPELGSGRGLAARAALERLTLGREATCVGGLQTYDRIAARCRVAGRAVGDLMREAGVPESRRATAPDTGGVTPHSAFRSCAAARAAGAAPLRRGQPGYGLHLDRDGDGVACEPYRSR